jgi:HAD superfamily hydrolase (TIGR01509 family)
MPIRGVIFDLDGTLVDSRLDFDLMRREMGIAGSPPLLEALAEMPPEDAQRCWRILEQHERRGAEQATVYPGVHSFLDELATRGLRRAVVTRNSRATTSPMLARLALSFDPVICREDEPIKPHPAAIWKICETWGIPPADCVMIGDYRFDIEMARAADMHAVLFTGSGHASGLTDLSEVDVVLASFARSTPFWAWLDQIDLESGSPS